MTQVQSEEPVDVDADAWMKRQQQSYWDSMVVLNCTCIYMYMHNYGYIYMYMYIYMYNNIHAHPHVMHSANDTWKSVSMSVHV